MKIEKSKLEVSGHIHAIVQYFATLKIDIMVNGLDFTHLCHKIETGQEITAIEFGLLWHLALKFSTSPTPIQKNANKLLALLKAQ